MMSILLCSVYYLLSISTPDFGRWSRAARARLGRRRKIVIEFELTELVQPRAQRAHAHQSWPDACDQDIALAIIKL